MGILILYSIGFTANTVVLFALILVVGLLIDGSIVMVEYAHRQIKAGRPPTQAYGLAARHLARPIIVSTATTLVAFLPLLFWPGTMGEFMKYLPITLIAVLTASLAMALIFVPTIGSVIGKSREISREERAQMAQAEKGDLTQLTGFTGKYVRVLKSAINHQAMINFVLPHCQ